MTRDDQPPKPAVARAPFKRHSGLVDGVPDADAAGLAALSERFGVPAVDLTRITFPLAQIELVPLEIARAQTVLPVLVRDDSICLAMANPAERAVIDELALISGRHVFPYVAWPEQLKWVIQFVYAARSRGIAKFVGARAIPTGATPAPRGPILGPAIAPSPIARGVSSPAAARATELLLDADLGEAGAIRAGPSVLPPGLPGVDPRLAAATIAPSRPAVLVVDSDTGTRKLVRLALEERGHAVIEAETGTAALAMIRQHTVTAVVLDAMLPEVHGFEVCKRIRASARYGQMPILVMSGVFRGWRFAEDARSTYGVQAWLEKPFLVPEFVAAFEAMSAGATANGAPPPEELGSEAENAVAAGLEAFKRGDLDGAIVLLETAVRLGPMSSRVHQLLGMLLARKGDPFRGIQELETAVNLNPRAFAALENLATLYEKSGFKHNAVETWERALGQSPDEATRQRIKEHLVSLL